MQYVNLTPHAVTIIDDAGTVTAEYPATGQVARAGPQVVGDQDGVSLVSYGDIVGIPDDVSPETILIVSLVTLLAAAASMHPLWNSMVAPWQEVRDSSGRIIGCRGLHAVPRGSVKWGPVSADAFLS